MKTNLGYCALSATLVCGILCLMNPARSDDPQVSSAVDPQTAAEPRLVHHVFFSLKDTTHKQRMLEDCKKYLDAHPGEAFFSVGILAEERKLRNSDRDFDIGLTIVFDGKTDLDNFDQSARHKQFVAEHSRNWEKVRVFDLLEQR